MRRFFNLPRDVETDAEPSSFGYDANMEFSLEGRNESSVHQNEVPPLSVEESVMTVCGAPEQHAVNGHRTCTANKQLDKETKLSKQDNSEECLRDVTDSIKISIELDSKKKSLNYYEKTLNENEVISYEDLQNVVHEKLDAMDKDIGTQVPNGWSGKVESSTELGKTSLASGSSSLTIRKQDESLSSEFSSISLDDIELGPEDLEDMPDSLKVEPADIFLVTCKDDTEKGRHFQTLLEEIKYTGSKGQNRMCKVLLLDDVQTSDNMIDSLLDAQWNSTFIFLLITREFCSDNVAEYQKNEAIIGSLTAKNRKWGIVPVFTVKKSAMKVPNGLLCFKGLDMSRLLQDCSEFTDLESFSDGKDVFFKKTIRSMLEFRTLNREAREAKQAKDKKEWLRQKKGDVRKQRARERHQTRLLQQKEDDDFKKTIRHLPTELLDQPRTPDAKQAENSSYKRQTPTSGYCVPTQIPPFPGSQQHTNTSRQVEMSEENYQEYRHYLWQKQQQQVLEDQFIAQGATMHQPSGNAQKPIVNNYNITAANVQIGSDNTINPQVLGGGGPAEDEADLLEMKYNPGYTYNEEVFDSGFDNRSRQPPVAKTNTPLIDYKHADYNPHQQNKSRNSPVEREYIQVPDKGLDGNWHGMQEDNSNLSDFKQSKQWTQSVARPQMVKKPTESSCQIERSTQNRKPSETSDLSNVMGSNTGCQEPMTAQNVVNLLGVDYRKSVSDEICEETLEKVKH